MRETIFLFSVASFISGISLRVVEPMLPQLATDFGVSVSLAATVITAYAVTYAVSPFAYGPLGDRYGRIPVVMMTSLFAALAAFGCAAAWDVTSLVLMRLFAGLFASSSFMLGLAYIGDRVPIAERQPVIARFVIGAICGQALGPIVGGVATDWIEHACQDTWRNIRDDLKQIQLAQLFSPHGRVWQVTEPSSDAAKQLKALTIKPPKPILNLD